MKLPLPEKDMVAHSKALRAIIANEIKRKGPIDFARYMQMALYEPGFGYYSAGAAKFGKAGDFVTAPEISPLFSRCVAQQCQQVLAEIPGSVILELGAGSGIMAWNILRNLDQWHCLPSKYFILEVSAELRQRQQNLFTEHAPQYLSRVQWLDSLPNTPIRGVIVANEVCDAMPVHVFKVGKTIQEYYIDWQNHALAGIYLEASPLVQAAVQALGINFPLHYLSEINLLLDPWIHSLASVLSQGAVFLFDYGYSRAEYFHPQRSMGTLRCHFRQYAHDDPLLYPGIQDITAFVDFTAIAQAAVAAHFEIGGFTHQAAFLLNCGLFDSLTPETNEVAAYARAQQLKQLLLPNAMGERYKAIALVKQFSAALLGFQQWNQTQRL